MKEISTDRTDPATRILVGAGLLLASLGIGPVGTMAAPTTVPDIASVPPSIKTAAGRDTWRQQVGGRPAPDGLGTSLPAGLSREALISLLVPDRAALRVSGVGAKPWPAQQGRFVAVVCTGGSVPTKSGDAPCTAYHLDGEQPLLAHVAVVALGPDGAPTLVSGPTTLDGKLDWADSGLPTQPEDVNDVSGKGNDLTVAPSAFKGFDLAPYRIAPDHLAFGIRATWSDGYSGGMGEHGALFLLDPAGVALRPVLAVPMSSFLMTAGDRHKDGTRDHDVQDAANVLVVTSAETGGHFDLLAKSVPGPWRRTYRWNATAGRYVSPGVRQP